MSSYTINKDGSITLRIYKTHGVRVPHSTWCYVCEPSEQFNWGGTFTKEPDYTVKDIYTNKEERVDPLNFDGRTIGSNVPSDYTISFPEYKQANPDGCDGCSGCSPEFYPPKKSLYQRLKELISKRKDKYNGK